jgi:DNA-binding MarR family transcriptional regulator
MRREAKSNLPPMGELLACPCLRLRQVSRKVSQIYDRALEPAELTSPQFALLVHLVAKPGLGMKALADAMVMDPTTLNRLLHPMVRRRLVETRTAGHDARSREVFITEAGRALLEAAIPPWQAANATVTGLIGPVAKSVLVGSLVRTLDSLTARQ